MHKRSFGVMKMTRRDEMKKIEDFVKEGWAKDEGGYWHHNSFGETDFVLLEKEGRMQTKRNLEKEKRKQKEIPIEAQRETPEKKEADTGIVVAMPRPDATAMQTMTIVRPLVDAETAVSAWNEFQRIKQKLIIEEDIQVIQNRQYIKKSGWRKIATVFNLKDEIVSEKIDTDEKGEPIRAQYVVRVTAPNGRSTEELGYCSKYEKNFAKSHDIVATAHTRAKSRAIASLVGGGAVSAEEIGE